MILYNPKYIKCTFYALKLYKRRAKGGHHGHI